MLLMHKGRGWIPDTRLVIFFYRSTCLTCEGTKLADIPYEALNVLRNYAPERLPPRDWRQQLNQ
jgi:hypothetical protein